VGGVVGGVVRGWFGGVGVEGAEVEDQEDEAVFATVVGER